MSDSSDDEDLSRFKDVVDTSFNKLIYQSRNEATKSVTNCIEKLKSERYLEEASHYNDVKVPEQMQKQIWTKVSAIIQKSFTFVETDFEKASIKHKIKGGVKLFRDSNGFLSCNETIDTYTENHNIESKKLNKKRRRKLDKEVENMNENDKIKATAVSGEYILSKEDTKYWKSRRKEKLFNYKGKKKSKILTLIE